MSTCYKNSQCQLKLFKCSGCVAVCLHNCGWRINTKSGLQGRIYPLVQLYVSITTRIFLPCFPCLTQVNDVVQWLDFDPRMLEGDFLQPGKVLKCMNWSGDIISVPSSCVRLPKSETELAQALYRRPRASVTIDFVASSKDEISVKVSRFIRLGNKANSRFIINF